MYTPSRMARLYNYGKKFCLEIENTLVANTHVCIKSTTCLYRVSLHPSESLPSKSMFAVLPQAIQFPKYSQYVVNSV